MTHVKRDVLIGLALTLAITALFWAVNLDTTLEALAYSPGIVHWPYASRQPWWLLYHWGTWPGLILCVAAALGWALSYTSPERARWRYPCLYLVALLALGPGLVINGFGKGLMGRPRPEETLAFGGTWRYLHPFQPGVPGRGRSFLCGHCSMGFLFFGLFYLWRGWRRWAAFAFAMVLGLALGAARVIQGAHYPSDVLLAGSVLFTLAAALSPLARRVPAQGGAVWGKAKTVAVGGGLAAAIVTAFLFSTPVYEEQLHLWYAPASLPTYGPAIDRLEVWKAGHGPAKVSVTVVLGALEFSVAPQTAVFSVHSKVTGFGFPGAKSRVQVSEPSPGVLDYAQSLHGLFVESHGQFDVVASPGLPLTAQLTALGTRGRVTLMVSDAAQPVHVEGLTPGTALPPGFRPDGPRGAFKPGRGPELELEARAKWVDLR